MRFFLKEEINRKVLEHRENTSVVMKTPSSYSHRVAVK